MQEQDGLGARCRRYTVPAPTDHNVCAGNSVTALEDPGYREEERAVAVGVADETRGNDDGCFQTL
jgi:hypothetical protein